MNRKQLEAFQTQNANLRREIIETRDVTLPNGSVLANRTLRHEVYDLPTGTVKIETTGNYTGWSNKSSFSYVLVGV